MSLIGRRNWALRLSVVLNVCVLLYVCTHLTSSGPWVEEASSSWVGTNVGISMADTYGATDNIQTNSSRKTRDPLSSKEKISSRVVESTENRKQRDDEGPSSGMKMDASTTSKDSKTYSKEKTTENSKNIIAGEKTSESQQVGSGKTIMETPVSRRPMSAKEAILCQEKSSEPRRAQRGDYWVLYNYVPMSINVKCWEAVTYTTHADYTFLDNLEPLLERWRAPISIALHAPGTDFQPTLNAIKYVRNCASTLISQLVTFHVYFSSKHVPKVVPKSEAIVSATYNCSLGPPWAKVVPANMYKNEKKLLYPVNVGRNVARETATTHYVLASDIELYPSPNLSTTFIEMITKNEQDVLTKPNPKVFVLSIFEVNEKSKPPLNKTALLKMLKNGTAITFHKKVCPDCHNVPKSKEWQQTPESNSLRVFHVGKRMGKFVRWEPIYIGTNSEPMYDERLSWEGKSDKMTQGYALCVLDYDFLILDNAFLVHRPGIKILKKDPHRDTLAAKTNMLIKRIIFPELKVMYGTRKGCSV